jgi:hypothetical protein
MQLRKLPLFELLTILTELYEDGVDYIDISGTPSLSKEYPQDTLKITVRPEYIEEEYQEEYQEEDITPSNINVSRLSEDDINDLI